ncbi:hypothetical protein G9E11_01785 [Arthrobacter sp. IA7]|uniref:hypothetical protein n=1 Tax=Arthrobacter ipis TaxID=2716202 RepID=UPI001689C571|nr:hypothetical protein [Arthrobacter ipis]MBD1541004.1 hypothetical protein [Arthrobacter ipis]
MAVKNPKKSSALEKTLVLTLTGVAVFAIAVTPNGHWPAAWGNFFGAMAVAIGGLLAALDAYDVVSHETRPASWAFIVVGGFAIAGASLQMALA